MSFSMNHLDLDEIVPNSKELRVKKQCQNIDFSTLRVESSLLKLLPDHICRKHNILPLKIIDEQLYIASSNYLKEEVLYKISFITGKNIKIVLCNKEDILGAIKRFYTNYEEKYNAKGIKEEKVIPYEENKEKKLEGPIIKLTDSIIEEAVWRKASDIHIEPFKDFALIRFRIDGILIEFKKISKKIYMSICTRIKIMSYMNIAEKNIPQDGKIQNNYRENNDFRVSTLPTVYGEKLVIRILYKNGKISDLNSLGFLKEDRKNIEKMLKKPNGLILVTGPTGSGKSTTLYSILKYINNKEKNIITIEEPVEYTIAGINQVNVDYKRNLTFLKGLKSILRQDPDIIMVGEIRDEETAKVAIRASITGHLVLSTLHTNGALESIVRLLDMNIEAYILSDVLRGIISQRLVRKICPHCKESYRPSKEEKEFINIKEDFLLYRGRGCHKCNNTGYLGRSIIYEYINIDKEKKNLIKNMIKDNNEKILLENNLKENINKALKQGRTSFSEIQKII
ncbi:GspE/PulE family protein [Clostridium botulinum]|uniref:GspE/PulE family protein n=1 Tax=Clostridium botulinum TaxID=1491 RepID=UPI000D135C60|nr:GspE/PulE family protein [Clostridium botulinum]AVQ46888.1 type II/IV secretion system protein [Clostridium botulinum]AVQ50034.1 type II/IV secretion system protein [Clostridium botulinum]